MSATDATPNAHLFLCNGARRTTGRGHWRSATPKRLGTIPGHQNVRLRIGPLSDRLGQLLPPRVLDLVELATLVYAADQRVPRLGVREFDYGRQWRRRFRFEVAVREPDFWSGAVGGGVLERTLTFLSDDHYEFGFELMADPPPQQTYFDRAAADPDGVPERVVLFSGGLDSLAGAAEEVVVHRRRVALVSHQPVGHMAARQHALVARLREASPDGRWVWPQHYGVEANLMGADNRDPTQRTRSFLFASIAAAVAEVFGLHGITFYENGVVSLNLPLCAQEVGGRATRTTHPRTLAGLAGLFTQVLGRPFTVDNPYLLDTKQDVLMRLKGAGLAHLASTAVSCLHTRDHTQPSPHCGACSQCFSRRFAALGAGYNDADDPAKGYRQDVICGARESDVDRILAERWVGSAWRLAGVETVQQFRQMFAGELARACPFVPPSADDAATQLFDLHRRHARQVKATLEAQAADLFGMLFNQRVPATSAIQYAFNLTVLADTVDPVPALDADAAAAPVPPPPPVVVQGEGRPVLVRGKEKPLTDDRYAVVAALVAAGDAGLKRSLLEKVRPSARYMLRMLVESDADWEAVIHLPGKTGRRYAIR